MTACIVAFAEAQALNFFMGKRAADEGRTAVYPSIDFCKNPNSICDPSSPPELKWVAGMFYWLNAVQPYNSGGWNYITELRLCCRCVFDTFPVDLCPCSWLE
eukprot:g23170.t1